MPHQIVFLGTKPIGYRCLEYLLSQREPLDIEVIGVGTKQRTEFGNNGDIASLAAANNIPLLHSPDDLPECDIIYSVQYHHILKPAHIAMARIITLNLHMAPLPEYRGCNQFSFAIIDGRKEFGTTLHQLDTGIDNGAILFEKRFPIPEGCWVDDLYQLAFEASVQLFQESLAEIINHNYSLTPQETLIKERGCSIHYRKEMEALKKIDLNWDAEKIDRYIRATAMPGFEPPYYMAGGKKIYFTREQS